MSVAAACCLNLVVGATLGGAVEGAVLLSQAHRVGDALALPAFALLWTVCIRAAVVLEVDALDAGGPHMRLAEQLARHQDHVAFLEALEVLEALEQHGLVSHVCTLRCLVGLLAQPLGLCDQLIQSAHLSHPRSLRRSTGVRSALATSRACPATG